MAKKSKKQKMDERALERNTGNRRGSSEMFRIVEDEVIVTTSRGVEVVCLGIAPAIEQQQAAIRDSYDWPEVPTRTMTDVAGSEMEVPLTQEYVDKYGTDEERAAWAEYTSEWAAVNAAFTADYNDKFTKLLAYKGVRVRDTDLLDVWAEEHEALGMPAPENAIERAAHFFTTEIVSSEEDIYAISLGIFRASGQDEEVLDVLENSFRSEVGAQGRRDDSGGAEDSTVQEPQVEEGLVVREDLDGAGDGTEVGADA